MTDPTPPSPPTDETEVPPRLHFAAPRVTPETQSPAPIPVSPSPKPGPSGPDSCARSLSPSSRPNFFRRTGHLWLLLLITLGGGAVRFHHLSFPAFWIDEAFTFSRITGTREQLYDVLKYDGFVPLHYELYWRLAQLTFMTPFMMRLIPALAGTLMIPVMYFLARRFTGIGPALVAALITASSAYLLNFSRDAKMYMHSWLAMALATALLLWWLRSRRWPVWLIGYPAWIAVGSAAVMLHATNMIVVLGLAPMFLLGSLRRPWWRVSLVLPLFVIGLAAIAYWPYDYYHHFNQWNKRTGGIFAGTVAAGTVEGQPGGGQGGGEAAAEGGGEGGGEGAGEGGGEGGAAVSGSEGNWGASGLGWIPGFRGDRTSLEMFRHSFAAYVTGWQWPTRQQASQTFGPQREPVIPRFVTDGFLLYTSLLVLLLGLGALPWTARWRGFVGPGDASLIVTRGPPGRVRPACDPPSWWTSALWLSLWLIIPSYGVFYCRSVEGFASPGLWLEMAWDLWGWWWPAMLGAAAGVAFVTRVLRGLGFVLTAGVLAMLAATLKIAVDDHGVEFLGPWLLWLSEPLPLGVLSSLGLGLIVHHSAPTLTGRLLRVGQALLLAAIVLGLCFGAYWLWYDFYLISQTKTPQTWLVRWMIQERLLSLPDKPQPWRPIWWHRYLGIVWPAVCIVLAVLIWRLPTRPLRWAAVLLVVGVNLANGTARIALHTQPPVDRMAADLWAAQPAQSSLRTAFLEAPSGRNWNLERNVRSPIWSYYLCLAGRFVIPPAEFRSGRVPDRLRVVPSADARQVPRSLEKLPHVDRLVVWERWPAHQPPEPLKDPVLDHLSDRWRLLGEEVWRVRYHWHWQQREWYRRREYQRKTSTEIAAPQTPVAQRRNDARPAAPSTRS